MLYGEPKIPESQDISAKARGGLVQRFDLKYNWLLNISPTYIKKKNG